MIRAENIIQTFGDQQVLKGINFTFEAGKNNLIIGRSGAGKTVLLKMNGMSKMKSQFILWSMSKIKPLQLDDFCKIIVLDVLQF